MDFVDFKWISWISNGFQDFPWISRDFWISGWISVTLYEISRVGPLGRKLQKDLRKRHRSPFVVTLNVPLCSLDANISVVRTIASDKGQEQR